MFGANVFSARKSLSGHDKISVEMWTGCVGGDWCGTSVEFRYRVNSGGFGNREGTSVELCWTRRAGSGGEF